MKIGIVGTGFIAEAMVDGLLRDSVEGLSFVLSPRNCATASRLASRNPSSVSKATSNQEVVDASDVVILSVRPAIAKDVIGSLRFRAEHTVVSVIAAIQLSEMRRMVSPARKVVLAIPLPAMSRCQVPLVITPDDNVVHRLFSTTTLVVAVDNEEAYAALGASTAIMASYFDIASRLTRWLCTKGVSQDTARMYISGLLSGLSDTARRETKKTFEQLATEHATPGSFNEKLLQYIACNDIDAFVADTLNPLLC